MAQTTNLMSAFDLDCGISTDGSTWTAIEGFVTTVDVSGGNRMTGAAYTGDGPAAAVTAGKWEPFDVTVSILYTEASGETGYPWSLVESAYRNGTNLYFRWAPKGISGTTNKVYYTGADTIATPGTPTGSDFGYSSLVTSTYFPGANPSSGDPIVIEIVFHTGHIAEDN